MYEGPTSQIGGCEMKREGQITTFMNKAGYTTLDVFLPNRPTETTTEPRLQIKLPFGYGLVPDIVQLELEFVSMKEIGPHREMLLLNRFHKYLLNGIYCPSNRSNYYQNESS